ncbi:CRACD-like protein [Anguilla anguilla]|uniref:CRACD-like protein n=1 Tax=Anguilla anguilla TaxID=7936 RepID=UPI0015A7ABEF|nr:CRACD-like protein [Anguilla anguilla]
MTDAQAKVNSRRGVRVSTGKKKSKLQVLRSRLFGRMKRKETEGLMKQSQSASDVTAEAAREGEGDSEDEFLYSHSRLASRAMSHDSIFLADEAQAPVEPVRILSQESVHGKIKALQMKLQQQNLRLGPPPLLIPGKRAEDTGVSSEDDGLPHSPPEISLSLPEGLARGAPKFPDTHRHLSSLSLAGTGSEEEEQACSQPSSRPLSPGTKPPPPTAPAAAPPPGVDFDSPAQFTPCLDNSAARHRMSVKPRNQRVSVKGRRLPSQHVSRPRSESLNALDRALPETDEEEEGEVPRDPIRLRSYSTQVIRSGEGGALRDPLVGKVRLTGEGFGVGHTDTDLLEEHVTMNPLFLRPMPQGLEAPWVLDLETGATPPNSAELQKPSQTEHPSAGPPQGGSDPGQRDSLKDTPAPSTTPTPTPAGLLSVSESGLPKSPMRRVQGVAREPVWPPAQPKTQPFPTPTAAAAAAAQQSTAPWRSSLKRNTTEQTQWDCLRPEPSQSVTAPPAGSDDQPSSEGADHGKPQGPGSGSFRFSIASAWDRPRGGSLLGREERRGAKSSSDSPEVPAGKPEEAKPRLQPLNPGSGGKGEGGPPVKASFPSSRREEETVAAPEEPKPKDQPRNLGLFQERTNPNARGKEGTAPRGPAWGAGGGGGGSVPKQVAVETATRGAEEGKDSRETRSRGSEEESEGEKDERATFGVRLRSTSQSAKYRQREAPNPETKPPSLSVEGCPPSQSPDHQASLPGQSRVPPGSPFGQSRNTQGGPLGQSRDTQGSPFGQSRDTQGCLQGQSRSPQALTPTKRPDLLKQHNVAAQGSQSLRREGEDRGAVPGHPCLKPPLHRTRTSPNSDLPASPAHPPSTPSSSTKCDHGDRERPGESKRGDDVDMPTDPSLDSGPAPKPASAPPKEAEPVVSEPVASEPAWMTMAREKTRSLQQMFTSRLPREFAVTTPTATPTATPKPSPLPAPLTPVPPTPAPGPAPGPAPQPAPQHPPLAIASGRGDRAPQGRADRGAPTEKTKNEKNEKTPLAESAAPPSDKRQERTDRSFPVGGKQTEAKAAPAETHSTAAAAPHRAEAKMEGRLACRVHSSEAAPSSTPAPSREREDRQPVRPEVLSAAPAVSSGGQPSWMELAKRKSLAWSDKAMD